MIALGEFIHVFRREFAPEVDDPLRPSTGLFDDLGLDSFDAFRMIIFLEDLADVPFPPDEVPQMFSVGDAFRYYEALCAYVDGN